MPISEEKTKALKTQMDQLKIYENDLLEEFILCSGKGGQKVNKTHNGVYLVHKPTNFSVKCTKTRSRELNRYYARKLLCEKIQLKVFAKKTKKQLEQEKIKNKKKDVKEKPKKS